MLLKYDGAGTQQWARFVGEIGVDDSANSVQQTSDGGYIVAGQTTSFITGTQDGLLLKFDGSGTLQWAKRGGGSTSSTSVQQTAEGGYIVAGSTASFGAGGSDVLVIRTDANGNIAGCSNSVSPVVGTFFDSSSTTYTIDSPNLSVGAPNLSVVGVKMKRRLACIR